VVAQMAGLAATDLPATPPDPAGSTEGDVRMPDPDTDEGGDADALAS
jgi:hypothetical protein